MQRGGPGRPFVKGQSGNPAGRQPGTRNRITIAIEALLDGEAEALTRTAIDLAKGGDLTALRLCLDRIVPPRRDRPVSFGLPEIASATDALKASSAVLASCAAGTLSPGEAGKIMALISTLVRTLEVADIEQRLIALEQGQAGSHEHAATVSAPARSARRASPRSWIEFDGVSGSGRSNWP